MQCNIVEYISYNMGNWDLPDISIHPHPWAQVYYQANLSCPYYNLYL